MVEVISRKIGRETVPLYTYDEQMRFRVSGSFYCAPDTAEGDAAANRMALTRYGDGSVCVVRQMLIKSSASNRQIQRLYEEILSEMEHILNIDEGKCSSSSWHVGHSSDNDDYLLTDAERRHIRAAITDSGQKARG